MKDNGFFLTIFEHSPVPTVILSGKFPDVFVRHANLAYLSLTGRRGEEMIGKPFLINAPHPGLHLDDEGLSQVGRSIEEVYRTKNVVKTPFLKFFRPLHSGDQARETIYLEATNTPILSPEGEIDFIIRTVQNATEVVEASKKEKSHERALHDKERFLLETQHAARIGSWEMDRTGRFKWSEIHYEIMEVNPETDITVDYGMSLLKSDEDRARFAEVYSQAIEKGDHFDVELCVITPRGNERWIRFMGRGELRDGEFIRTFGIGQDITLQKKIQDELRTSRNQLELIVSDLRATENRLRSLVDSQTNYVIRINFNVQYTYANNTYLKSFGPPEGEGLIGTNAMHTIVPEHHERVKEVSLKCSAEPNKVFEVELKKLDKEGNIRHTFWHFVCLTGSAGEPSEFQCIGIDVSDWKKAELDREVKAAELKQSEKRYSDLFQLSPQPLWVYDPLTLDFLDVNQAAVEQYGYSREEFLAMKFSDVYAEEVTVVDSTEDRLATENNFYQVIFIHKIKGGELIQVDMKQSSIPFRGKMANIVLAINISEPLKYLATLKTQNKRLAEIAWVQSHMVRAPLSRLMGLVDILRNNYGDPEERDFFLDSIASSAMELDQVIKDVVRKAEEVQPSSIPGSEHSGPE